MSTTLQEQLKRLSVPQTASLSSGKSKASILFDKKEAAAQDRRSIFDLGRRGLEELIQFNSAMRQFQATLFNEETIHLERSVENAELNKILNLNITKFCRHLSPYVLLRPAHMCIEWLLRRFHVHEYNRDALLELVLPYHETNIFVRIIQTFRIKESDTEWKWLKPLQGPGVPISKNTLINRAATNQAFFKFICTTTLEAINELGHNAHFLQAQINFYGAIVVGVLYKVENIKEWHLTLLMRSLLAGFKSNTIDYTSASYMITALLLRKATLTSKLCKTFVSLLVNPKFDSLSTSSVCLLITIFKLPDQSGLTFSEKDLKHFILHPTQTNTLMSVSMTHDISPLTTKLLTAAFTAIQNKSEDTDIFKDFVCDLFRKINFSASDAHKMLLCLLDCFDSAPQINGESDVIDLDNYHMSSAEYENWYFELISNFERQYPSTFDTVVGSELKTSSKRRAVIRTLLSKRLRNITSNHDDIYDSLRHPNANIRAEAVKIFVGHLSNSNISTSNQRLFIDCLVERITDDCPIVVTEVLQLATIDFVKILGIEKFITALVDILTKMQANPKDWCNLINDVVRHFLADIILENYDNYIILVFLTTFLFPNVNSSAYYDAIVKIGKSNLAKKFKFLGNMITKIKIMDDIVNPIDIRKSFIDAIMVCPYKVNVMELIESFERHSDNFWKSHLNAFHLMVILNSSIQKNLSSSQRLHLFEKINVIWMRLTFLAFDTAQTKMNHFEKTSINLLSDILAVLVRDIKSENLCKWHQMDSNLECFLKILAFVTDHIISLHVRGQLNAWLPVLHRIFHIAFNTTAQRVEFLINFYSYTNLKILTNYTHLRASGFKLLGSILKTENSPYAFSTRNVIKMFIILSDKRQTIRELGLLLLNDLLKVAKLEKETVVFVQNILSCGDEIKSDHERFPLYIFLLFAKSSKLPSTIKVKILKEMLAMIKTENAFEENPHLCYEILNMLKHMDNEEILDVSLALTLKSLDKFEINGMVKTVKEPFINIVKITLLRFNVESSKIILNEKPDAWKIIRKIITSHDMMIVHNGKLSPLPCLAIEILREIFPDLTISKKEEIMNILIKTISQTIDSDVYINTNKLLQQNTISCKSFVSIIENMYKNLIQTIRKRKSQEANKPNEYLIHMKSVAWKEGIVLLELLEGKTRLTDTEILIPPLFQLLRVCMEHNVGAMADYSIRLALSMLLHCCTKAQIHEAELDKIVPNAAFRIDLVVQCVRNNANIQIQQIALLLLAKCAELLPQRVLHSTVDVFTFMGTSVLRQDDTYSLHIVNNVIDSIIPMLVKSKGGKRLQHKTNEKQNPIVIQVLKVFSDIMLDVPTHRRIVLYTKLINTLGVSEYLWQFLCIVFEAQIVADEERPKLNPRNGIETSKRFEFVMELIFAFKIDDILQTCIELTNYLNTLPMPDESTGRSYRKLSNIDNLEVTLFNANYHSSKHLRHYIFIIIHCLSTVTSSPKFVTNIALLDNAQQENLRSLYQTLIIKIVAYFNKAIEQFLETTQKFWKVVQNNVEDLLSNTVSLLSSKIYLLVIENLMENELISVRRKAIELFVKKYREKDAADNEKDQSANFKSILFRLTKIALTTPKDDSSSKSPAASGALSNYNESILLQQHALNAIKLLSQMFAFEFIDEFKEILQSLLTIIVRRDNESKIVWVSTTTTMIEVSCNLKAHSLAQLGNFMPHFVDILKKQADFLKRNILDNVCITIISGVQKLFESLSMFLGPYVMDITTTLCYIVTYIDKYQFINDTKKNQIYNDIAIEIHKILEQIGMQMPLRMIVPCCCEVYADLIQSRAFVGIRALMKLLLKAIDKGPTVDFPPAQLDKFFMNALEFRLSYNGSDVMQLQKIAETEDCILDTMVSWIMKKVESVFRLYYNQIYDWAFQLRVQNETALTFFRLTNKIVERMKHLFVIFIVGFMENIVTILDSNNTTKNPVDDRMIPLCEELLTAILSTLSNIFVHNSDNHITARRFNVLLEPITAQLENEVILNSVPLQQLLCKTIAQMTNAASNDMVWKQINYQVLLKTRSCNPDVRIFAFDCCVGIARILGINFTPSLPETVTFIAELYEDENEAVEANTRERVQELEGILGESINQYMN